MARKRKPEEGKSGSAPWMNTYADLVTLLLCFFVLLFSMSSIDVAKFKAAMSSFKNQIDIMPGGTSLTDDELIANGISQINGIETVFDNKIPLEQEGEEDADITESKLAEARKDAEDINEYLKKEGYENEVDVKYNSNVIKLTIEGEILFESGRAKLTPDAIKLVDVISVKVKEHLADKTIQIEGHTDNRPINTAKYPSNWELSQARAIAVGYRLINEHGIDPSKIAATGYGEYRPLTDNSTPEGRAINRRVEIKLVTEEYKDIDELNEVEEVE
ncbi:OmpA/MotB protein [Vallitalea longa]|uniref:OmpA/MotB protein n=1 Tax=Vallitalea longa TaxID=2936439 RepID=A0A9W5YD10_9FIRM|nr:OmpA family protein [Vallitalea longa]GKX28978.1 OmpA/MotB protein [Vallitalea longa]